MAVQRKRTTTDIQGTENSNGSQFDDKASLGDVDTAMVTRVVITYDDHLRSITVCPYLWNTGMMLMCCCDGSYTMQTGTALRAGVLRARVSSLCWRRGNSFPPSKEPPATAPSRRSNWRRIKVSIAFRLQILRHSTDSYREEMGAMGTHRSCYDVCLGWISRRSGIAELGRESVCTRI